MSVAAIDSQEYDARLCSAELVVLKGDLQRFLNPSTPTKQREGYQQRMAGALGTLNWLCRQYASLHDIDSHKLQLDIKQLQGTFKEKNWNRSKQILRHLIAQMPLSTKGLKPEEASKEAIQTGKEIYKSYCQACHRQAELRQARPAYSLFKMAKNLTQKEFIARMIVGVHGTPEIALQNPLTDDDIAGMYHYLLTENK